MCYGVLRFPSTDGHIADATNKLRYVAAYGSFGERNDPTWLSEQAVAVYKKSVLAALTRLQFNGEHISTGDATLLSDYARKVLVDKAEISDISSSDDDGPNGGHGFDEDD